LFHRLPLISKITSDIVAERELVKYFSRTVTITRVNHAERELVQHSSLTDTITRVNHAERELVQHLSLTDTITRVNLAARFIPMGGEGRTISILSTVSCSHKFRHQGCTIFLNLEPLQNYRHQMC
jgi:hypothetical protein